MQHKTLDYNKNYKVSGMLLQYILDLQVLFENDVCKTETYSRDKVNYVIGKLVNEFVNKEWEVIE